MHPLLRSPIGMHTLLWTEHHIRLAGPMRGCDQTVSRAAAAHCVVAGLKKVLLVVVQVITHELPLTEAPHAYKIFNEKKDGCVKVVMHPWQ